MIDFWNFVALDKPAVLMIEAMGTPLRSAVDVVTALVL